MTTLIQKDPSKRTDPKQLKTHNLPTANVENINSTKKGRDLPLANMPRIFPWRTESMPQMIPRYSRVTLHRYAHPKQEHERTEISSYGLDWLQKEIWYRSPKLDNKLLQNVENIRWSQKIYRENHENLETGIDNRGKKLSWSKDPKMYFLRRYTIIVTIHNWHNTI